jgi:hypothetical protein
MTAAAAAHQSLTPADAHSRLRDHLDGLSLVQVAASLGLSRKAKDGHVGPALCPRHECRSPRVWTVADGWDCPQCGAGGRGAALLCASVAGWLGGDPAELADLSRDLATLMLEALCAGLVDPEDPSWQAFYALVPGAADFERRGLFEGDDRAARLRPLATALVRSRLPGAAVARMCWAWSCAYCRPPLTSREIADVLARIEVAR